MNFLRKRSKETAPDVSTGIDQERETEIKAELGRSFKEIMYTSLGTYGTGNMYASGEMMYDALFATSPTESIHGYVRPIDESILNPNRIAPNKAEFTAWFREALVHDPELQKACAFPGVLEAVDTMLEAGPLIIWTEGDTRSAISGTPGSGEQLEKIRGIGIFQKGVEKALSQIAIDQGTNYGQHFDIEVVDPVVESLIAAEASEHKFSNESLTRVFEHLHEQGITHAVVLEDRLSNAVRMRALLGSNGFEATGIWVRQGRHGRREGDHDDTILEAQTIAEASEMIKAQREETGVPIGIVSDLDGVLADQEARERLQTEALYEKCLRSGWLRK
ncbi:MAG: hypothetical protein ABIP74_01415 [Candidatus Saccharimonas sp.]